MVNVGGRSLEPPRLILRPEQPPDVQQKKSCLLLVHDGEGGKATVQKEVTGMLPLRRFTPGVQSLRFDGQPNVILLNSVCKDLRNVEPGGTEG